MILHISVGFSYSKVYDKLFTELGNQGIEQYVYNPQHINDTNINEINKKNYNYNVYSSKIIKKLHKFFYFNKVNKMTNDIQKNIDLKKVELVHAHSIFTDGGLAYSLYKKYNIPYIVAVRDMDINKYYKYAKHLKKYARNILDNAEKIIFISPAYKDKLFKVYEKKSNYSLKNKSIIIPNGIDSFWHNDKQKPKKYQKNKPLNLMFIGQISKRKNLKTVIDAVLFLKNNGIEAKLEIIGDGPLLAKYKQKYKEPEINFVGKIKDKDILRENIIKNDILIVPSFTETFGLVYIESMSCGTPVIFTKGQGIDGYFKNGHIGYTVNPTSINDIIKSIDNIIKDYQNISKNCLEESRRFNWKDISIEYIKNYKDIIEFKGDFIGE